MIQEFQNVKVYFNMMDAPNKPGSKYAKVSYSDEGTFGNYDLAEKMLSVEYTNQDVAKKIRDKTEATENPKTKIDSKDHGKV